MHHTKILLHILILTFLLGSYKGYLALWKGSDPEPFQIYPVAISSLPEADQSSLSQGITAYSQRQLDKLLEDYLS